jgi:chemotaxis protein CheX
LKIQCQFEARPKSPYVLSRGDPEFKPDIIALIGLTSKVFNGTVALCFQNQAFLKIMSNMLGEDCKEVTQELENGAGELLNIIFGQAKIKLNAQKHGIEKAIPSVVRGRELNLSHNASTVILVLPFESEFGELQIQIAVQKGMK